jgi:hypothetical protein
MRFFRILFPALIISICATIGCSVTQAAALPSAAAPARSPGTYSILLGKSVEPLYGPWRFTVGDSPLDPATGKPAWAEPDFDDSKWETVDLTPEAGSFNPITGIPGAVPGWTQRGHPGYWGYGWYRIHVQVKTGADGLRRCSTMEGALPLGAVEGAEFSVTQFQLKPNDRLVLASDGLAEAMDAAGQLFGFTRVQELVQQGKSAEEIANAIQAFGQEDDISIITLTRTTVGAPTILLSGAANA